MSETQKVSGGTRGGVACAAAPIPASARSVAPSSMRLCLPRRGTALGSAPCGCSSRPLRAASTSKSERAAARPNIAVMSQDNGGIAQNPEAERRRQSVPVIGAALPILSVSLGLAGRDSAPAAATLLTGTGTTADTRAAGTCTCGRRIARWLGRAAMCASTGSSWRKPWVGHSCRLSASITRTAPLTITVRRTSSYGSIRTRRGNVLVICCTARLAPAASSVG